MSWWLSRKYIYRDMYRDYMSWILYVVMNIVIKYRDLYVVTTVVMGIVNYILFLSWIYVVICCRGFPVVSICRGICRECEIFWNHLFHSKQVFCKFWDHFLKAGVDEKFLIFFFRSWIYVVISHRDIHRDIKSWDFIVKYIVIYIVIIVALNREYM